LRRVWRRSVITSPVCQTNWSASMNFTSTLSPSFGVGAVAGSARPRD
jgi:hypothetical protein